MQFISIHLNSYYNLNNSISWTCAEDVNFIYLLCNYVRWRIRLRKALSSSSQVTPKVEDDAETTKVKDDDQLLQEMEELTSVIDRKKKREKKRLAKRRAKVLWITYTNLCNMWC